MAGHLKGGHSKQEVLKRPGSSTTMLMNHHQAYTFRICIKNLCKYNLEKIHVQMSTHDKRYRSEEISPATRDINFGISIKVPQKVDLKIPQILRKLLKKISGLIFLCLFLPSKWAQNDNLEGKKRQRKMNPKISSDNFFNMQGIFRSTF